MIVISKEALERFSNYLAYLKIAPSQLKEVDAEWLSAKTNVDINAVNNDLKELYPNHTPGAACPVADLTAKIEIHLGYRKAKSAILVGAGKLGRALMDYEGFKEQGLEIKAAFDANPYVLDASRNIYALDKLELYCKDHDIKIGIITAPKEYAQGICDEMVKSGIEGIWCFAPLKLDVPEHVMVVYENMSISLAALSNHISQ